VEPHGAKRGGELGVKHLEGHRTVMLQVVGEEDSRHPAAAELALEAVAFAEGRSEAGNGVDERVLVWERFASIWRNAGHG
jgi:hypothetical protein